MAGFDRNYVPGWDCHGLPIEWKIEEEYIAKGKPKPNLADPEAMKAFRAECRAFAEHWLNVQREEFKRLGVEGDWSNPYSTMTFPAEAQIARELMKFAETGQLYRGSKPVMWSRGREDRAGRGRGRVPGLSERYGLGEVSGAASRITASDRTARAERPRPSALGESMLRRHLDDDAVDDPGQPRDLVSAPSIEYGLYEVTKAPENNWAKVGDKYILADKLAAEVMKAAKVEALREARAVSQATISPASPAPTRCASRPRRLSASTSPCSTAITSPTTPARASCTPRRAMAARTSTSGRPSPRAAAARARHRSPPSPTPSTRTALYTKDAPGFEGERVITDKGDKGDANDAVIKALADAGMMIARGAPQASVSALLALEEAGDLPQYAAVVHPHGQGDRVLEAAARRHSEDGAGQLGNQRVETLREVSLQSIRETEWVPTSGENRITGMIEAKPDWVISRQRAWGVPITVFVKKGTHDVLVDPKVNQRIYDAMFSRRRRRLVRRHRRRALPEARLRPGRLREGQRRARRLVRFRLARTPTCWRTQALPRPRRHQAQGRWRPRHASCISKARTSIAAGSIRR